MEEILELKQISKTYEGKKILSNLSLKIYRGEIYGLLGKNGIGKTTLLKIITKAIPNTQFNGDVLIYGSKKIGSLIENPSCYIDLSVKSNLEVYSTLIVGKRKERIEKVVKGFELGPFLNKKAKNLSMGMLQKLKLAMAFLTDGEILILDEPFNGLDIDGVISLRKQIKQVSHTEDKAIIITSHNTAELDKLCDRFGILHKGKIQEVSKNQQNMDLEDIYLSISNEGVNRRVIN